MEKSYDGKRFKSEREKRKDFVLTRELYQWKFLSFHAHYIEEEWKETPFYTSNVTVRSIEELEDVLEQENA